MTGRPRREGLSRISMDAKKASMSMWRMAVVFVPGVGGCWTERESSRFGGRGEVRGSAPRFFLQFRDKRAPCGRLSFFGKASILPQKQVLRRPWVMNDV